LWFKDGLWLDAGIEFSDSVNIASLVDGKIGAERQLCPTMADLPDLSALQVGVIKLISALVKKQEFDRKYGS
jgi:hypothetical protein